MHDIPYSKMITIEQKKNPCHALCFLLTILQCKLQLWDTTPVIDDMLSVSYKGLEMSECGSDFRHSHGLFPPSGNK